MKKTVLEALSLATVLTFAAGSGLIAGCAAPQPITGPADRPSAPAATYSRAEAAPAPIVTKGPKKRVAVVKFQDRSAYGRGRLGGAIREILETELSKSGEFIMVTRGDMDLILDEQDLAKSGTIKTGTGPKSGQVLGLNAIVTGAVTQFGVKQKSATYLVGASKTQTAEATVDIKVIDATTGQIIYADSGTGVHEESSTQVLGIGGAKGYDETLEGKAFRAAVGKFIDNLIRKMASIEWSGKVAAVEGDEVTVNAGRKTGLSPGDRLRVYGEGREVIDPDTKVSLGRKPGKEKGEVVVKEFFGEDAAVCRLVSGEGVAVNDIVKLAR
ncbi:MAG: hypothetical protein HZA60_01300 [Deltaproteobacteria bacterium]|nr:hypothetical protein [Deltaproteobacteria bacterium]